MPPGDRAAISQTLTTRVLRTRARGARGQFCAEAEGGKFDAPKEPKWFSWKDGSGDIALNKAWASKIPAEVQKLVDDTIAAIKSGAKTVELNLNEVKSD